MRSLRAFAARVCNIFSRSRSDDDLAEEIEGHLQAHIDDKIRGGMTQEEARRDALLSLGGIDATKESQRDRLVFPTFDAAVRDIRYAGRLLRRTPGFTFTAIATLGIAIGACTAVYSIVYGLVLRGLPYPHPDRLVQLAQVDANGRLYRNFSDPNFEDVRDQTASFRAMAEFNQFGFSSVLVGDVAVRARLANVSNQFFDVLGVEPAIGRRFLPDEAREGGAHAVIVSYDFWRQQVTKGRDPLNAQLKINGELYTMVGVMPTGFAFPPDTELWTPRELRGRNPFRTGHNWHVVARLRDDVSMQTARVDVTTVARRLKAQYGRETMMSDVAVSPLHDELLGGARPVLLLLFASVGLLLVVACASLANVLLARVTARRREFAVRAALGANSSAMTLPLVAESLMLCTAGGLVGVALAAVAVRTPMLIDPTDLPHIGEIRLSWPVLLFSSALTCLTAVALSLIAAARQRRPDVAVALSEAQRSQTATRSISRLRNGLVVAQLVVSVVLLVGAGLLGRSLMSLLSERLGFRTAGVLTIDTIAPTPHVRVTPNGLQFDDPAALPRQAQLNERILQKLGTLPGVVDVGGIDTFPLPGDGADGTFIFGTAGDRSLEIRSLSDALRTDPSRTGYAAFRVATATYFRTMGISLLRGRLFDEHDGPDAPHVAVISETLAKTRWPDRDPIGLHIQFGGMDGDLHVFTVVGVVGDVRERGLDAPPLSILYADYRQRPLKTFGFTFVLRTAGPAVALTNDARRVLHDLAPEVAPRFRTAEEIVDQSITGRRFTFLLAALFAGGAVLVAVLGIYGVLAFLVAERSHEFGIRMALGAGWFDVQRLVLSRAAALVTTGLTVGLAIAAAVCRLMTHQLYRVQPTDPLTYVTAAGLIAAVAFAACELPALRATRVNPLVALRVD